MLTLEQFAEEARPAIAGSGAEHGVVLSARNLPQPPDELCTVELAGLSGLFHEYDRSFAVPGVQLYSKREGFRSLGLLVFSALFHEEPAEVVLHLNSAVEESGFVESEVTVLRRIVVRFGYVRRPVPNGLWEQPMSFSYWPHVEAKHPWPSHDAPYSPSSFPHAYVSDAEDVARSGAQRDTVFGFGSAIGCARLAGLLVNMATTDAKASEHELETEVGFRGVAPGSVELAFYAPGSVAWDSNAGLLGL